MELTELRAEHNNLLSSMGPIRALAALGTTFQNHHSLLSATPQQLNNMNPEILIASGKKGQAHAFP